MTGLSCAVRVAAEGAERRRDASRLDVERVPAPRPHADVGGIRGRLLEVLRPDFADEREPLRGTPRRGEPEPHHAQRVVLVVRVVEPRHVVEAAQRRDDLAADGDPAVERADGSLRQRLGVGARGCRRARRHDSAQQDEQQPAGVDRISTWTSPRDHGSNGEHTIIIVGMEPMPGNTPIFSLEQARALLPQVKHLTADAVRRAESPRLPASRSRRGRSAARVAVGVAARGRRRLG